MSSSEDKENMLLPPADSGFSKRVGKDTTLSKRGSSREHQATPELKP
jgi:hypothetical protein